MAQKPNDGKQVAAEVEHGGDETDAEAAEVFEEAEVVFAVVVAAEEVSEREFDGKPDRGEESDTEPGDLCEREALAKGTVIGVAVAFGCGGVEEIDSNQEEGRLAVQRSDEHYTHKGQEASGEDEVESGGEEGDAQEVVGIAVVLLQMAGVGEHHGEQEDGIDEDFERVGR